MLVGFAAETEDLAKNARAKLKAKNLDLIVVNPVGGPDSGFDSDTNRASIIDADGAVQEIPLMSKVANGRGYSGSRRCVAGEKQVTAVGPSPLLARRGGCASRECEASEERDGVVVQVKTCL